MTKEIIFDSLFVKPRITEMDVGTDPKHPNERNKKAIKMDPPEREETH